MSTRQHFMAAGVNIIPHMGNVQVTSYNLIPDAVAVIPHLRETPERHGGKNQCHKNGRIFTAV